MAAYSPGQALVAIAALLLLLLLPRAPSTSAFSPALVGKQSQTFVTILSLGPQQLGTFESLLVDEQQVKLRTVKLHDWSEKEPMSFHEGWNFQKSLLSNHLNRLQGDENQFSNFDSVIMLQHYPVYTLGTASDPDFVLTDQVEVVRMDRGGEVTYHGPGQLVVYPVIDLRGYKQDIHWYMRALEECILVALSRAGVSNAVRENNVTGIWIEGKKVAAIGIKARRWITQHGLAVNIESDSLRNFAGIVPCGLEGREVTCVNHHLSEPISVKDFAAYMKDAMQEIFCVRFI